MWVANKGDGTVWRLNPASGAVIAKVNLAPGVTEVAAGGDQVWVDNPDTEKTYQINPASNLVVTTVPLDGELAISGGTVWMFTKGPEEVRSGFFDLLAQIYRLGSTGNGYKLIGTAWRNTGAAGPEGFAVDGDTAWVTESGGSDVVRLDLSLLGRGSKSSRHIPMTSAPDGLTLDGHGDPWVVAAFQPALSEISPITNSVASTISIGGQPIAVAADSSGVYAIIPPTS